MLADAKTLLADLLAKTLTPNLGFGGNACPHINAASSVRTINPSELRFLAPAMKSARAEKP